MEKNKTELDQIKKDKEDAAEQNAEAPPGFGKRPENATEFKAVSVVIKKKRPFSEIEKSAANGVNQAD